MAPRRVALFLLLEVLLRADLCTGIRKKATLAATLAQRMEKMEATSEDAATRQLQQDMIREAQEGVGRLDHWECTDLTRGITGQLLNLDRELSAGGSLWVEEDLNQTHDDPWNPAPQGSRTERVHNITTTLATAVMALDEKRCMVEALQDQDLQNYMTRLYSKRVSLYTDEANPESSRRAQLAFSRLGSWQEALVGLGEHMIDREQLYPRDLSNIYDCPQPCNRCSHDHSSLFKGEESDKFKCYLNGRTPPNPEIFHCDKVTRRSWQFWEYKTWCTVPGWIMDSYQNARIAAMVTCGTHSLLATLRTDEVMPADVKRTCMLVEQRMVVTYEELQVYKEFMVSGDDGVVPLGLQYVFGAYVTMATAQGLVALRDSTTDVPTSNDDWQELLIGNGFTLLPPALVPSVPCRPPVDNWEVFMGAFAAVAAIGSGAMMGILAVMPLVLLTGLFFVLAFVVLLAVIQTAGGGGGEIPVVIAYFGVVAASLIPQIFVSVFSQVSTNVYNALVPQKSTKACPAGIVFLPGSEPTCIEALDVLEAKRYTCPLDVSRAVVVSCEPEFNGVAVLRGNPC